MRKNERRNEREQVLIHRCLWLLQLNQNEIKKFLASRLLMSLIVFYSSNMRRVSLWVQVPVPRATCCFERSMIDGAMRAWHLWFGAERGPIFSEQPFVEDQKQPLQERLYSISSLQSCSLKSCLKIDTETRTKTRLLQTNQLRLLLVNR